MAIPWNDRVNFCWDDHRLVVGRTMSLGAAVDYFATLSTTQRQSARINLSTPLQIVPDLPPAYELSGGKIATLIALRADHVGRC